MKSHMGLEAVFLILFGGSQDPRGSEGECVLFQIWCVIFSPQALPKVSSFLRFSFFLY